MSSHSDVRASNKAKTNVSASSNKALRYNPNLIQLGITLPKRFDSQQVNLLVL
jgi:uncharacterized protein (UPF0333 family)